MGGVAPSTIRMGRPSYIQLGQGDEDDDDFDVEVGGGGGEGGEEDHVQVIWMDGEGRLEGYRQTRLRRMVFILLNVVTFGVPWLIIAALRPKLLLTLEGKRVELRRSEKVLLTTFGQNVSGGLINIEIFKWEACLSL